MKCPHCGHEVALDAKACPSCGKLEPAKGAGEAAVAIAALLVAAVVYVSPAMLVNHLFGRFDTDLIDSTLGDLFSWIYSTTFWLGLAVLIFEYKSTGRIGHRSWVTFLVALLFLGPAIGFNSLTGRFEQDLVGGTFYDMYSWLGSALSWTVVFAAAYILGTGSRKSATSPAEEMTSASVQAVGSASVQLPDPAPPVGSRLHDPQPPLNTPVTYKIQFRSSPSESWRFTAGTPAAYDSLSKAEAALNDKCATSVSNEYRIVRIHDNGFVEPT